MTDDAWRQLKDPAGPAVVRVGRIPDDAFGHWLDRVTDEIVITRERRRHYLDRHPEVEADEAVLLRALLDPEEVHINRINPRMAIIYYRIDTNHYVRIPVWVSNRDDRQNSVLSFRRAGTDEVVRGRVEGRRVWMKK